jgi:hypothetical protein
MALADTVPEISMEIRTSTIAVIAASCITVGAAAAYLANRPSPAPQQTAPVSDVEAAGVDQSEALVSDAPAPPTAERTVEAAPPVAAPAPSKVRPATTRSVPAAKPPSSTAVGPAVDARRPATPQPQPRTVASAAPVATRPATVDHTAPVEHRDLVIPTESLEPKTPPAPRYVDLVVSTDSVLGLQIESPITSDTARVEDEVVARVTRDVRVGDRVAIPAGAQARGEVTLVERGGKVRDRARLGIRFTSVVLDDGTRVPIETETIYREGSNPTGASTAKIGGGAIGGAIIGGIFGGAKGAAIGAATGAGAGTAAVMAGGRSAATLPAGTPVTVRVTKPATVTVDE